jgi:arginine transport system substrate-binding protein
MYRVLISSLLLLGAAVAVIACNTGAPKKESLVVGIEAGYAPYALHDEQGKAVGLDLDVAAELAKRLDKRLEIREMAWDALIVALKQGKIDLWMSGVSVTPERTAQIAMIPYLTEPLTEYTLIFWDAVPDDLVLPQDLAKLGAVAVQIGTPMESWLQQVAGVETKSMEAVSDMIMALKYQKVVAGLIEPLPAQAIQRQLPNVVSLPVSLDDKNALQAVGIGVRYENRELVEAVTQAIEEMKKEGSLAAIEAKWKGATP